MKKIVSAAVAATLLAGAAFAEVTLSTNYRLGSNVFTVNPGEGGAADVQGFNDLTKANWADTTKISAKGEHAGIEYDLKTAEGTLSSDYAFAWLNWGSFTLYGGTRDERGFIKRVNPLDGNWWNNYCEYGKPGLHKDLKVGLDSGNVTANQAGSKAVNYTAKYAIDDTMNVNVAFFQNATSEKLADKLNVAAQFNMKQDAFILNATAKFIRNEATDADDNVWSLGAFVNILAVKDVDMLLGATFYKDEAGLDKVITGIDARFSTKIDALTLASLNNITVADGDMISWHTIDAAYKVSDVITAAGAQVIINSTADADWSSAGDAGKNKEYFAIRPYVDLTAQKNAVLSIGAELKFVNFMKDSGEKTDFQMTVPMVMRVKM